MAEHTPTPWFVSGVRFRMNGGEWHSINRYDESKKQDENIACAGYDARTGLGLQDAHFIVKAVNNHDALVKALEEIERRDIYQCSTLVTEGKTVLREDHLNMVATILGPAGEIARAALVNLNEDANAQS